MKIKNIKNHITKTLNRINLRLIFKERAQNDNKKIMTL